MRIYLLIVLFVSSALGSMYNTSYTVVNVASKSTKNKTDAFMDRKLVEIRKFDTLEFNNGRIENKSKDNLKAIIATINSYIENKKDIRVNVIGYARTQTDRHEEVEDDSSDYASSINHTFRFIEPEDEAEESSTVYASYIVSKLEDNNIPKNIILKKFQESKALGYTSTTEKGLNLPDRVVVTMYVAEKVASDVVTKSKVLNKPIAKKSTAKVILSTVAVQKVIPATIEVTKDVVEPVVVKSKTIPSTAGLKKIDTNPDTIEKPTLVNTKVISKNTPSGYNVNKNGIVNLVTLSASFEIDSTTLPTKLKIRIEEFSNYLKENPQIRAKIVGHTSRTQVSGYDYNMKLSKERAKRIRDELVNVHGINPSRLATTGKGYTIPIADNLTLEGRIQNRRVEIKLFKNGKKIQ